MVGLDLGGDLARACAGDMVSSYALLRSSFYEDSLPSVETPVLIQLDHSPQLI